MFCTDKVSMDRIYSKMKVSRIFEIKKEIQIEEEITQEFPLFNEYYDFWFEA